MPTLIEILKDDYWYVVAAVQGFSRGVLHGLYSPFLINTGVRRAINTFKDNMNNSWETGDRTYYVRAGSDLLGQILTSATVLSQTPFFVPPDMMRWYGGAIVASNVADFLFHAYKRTKQTE